MHCDVWKTKKHENLIWEIKTPFNKASATFIGRLICVDMQLEQWMEKAWKHFFFPFLTLRYWTLCKLLAHLKSELFFKFTDAEGNV